MKSKFLPNLEFHNHIKDSNSSFYDKFQLKNGLCFDILNFNKNNSFLSGTSMTADEDYIRINIFIKDITIINDTG